jgi:hypothetical protein
MRSLSIGSYRLVNAKEININIVTRDNCFLIKKMILTKLKDFKEHVRVNYI